ncbi:MAG: hypothetical protein HYT14_00995 [Candidatus Liptonbacteria bacterium]|nr:hypothetical protein [Candidatus Liptonbacteria bacterium]
MESRKTSRKGRRDEDSGADKWHVPGASDTGAANGEVSQEEYMNRDSRTAKKMDALEPDAFAFFNAAAQDGLAPKNFVSLEALRAVAVKQGKPLSMEQLSAYYGADASAERPVMECSVCGKTAVARVWAIASKGAIVADRDSAEGKPLLVGTFVKRYNASGEPIAMVGCGSPARTDSCLMFLREVKETRDGVDGAGNKVNVPVLFTDRYNRPKRLPSLPYAKVVEEIAKETTRRAERQNDEQSRLARLGGLVNRERTTGQSPYRFDPRTPRGQRRDGGTTPHDRGR